MRRIVCKNVNNMRDLGGYLTRDGAITKNYRYVRSNLPNGLLDEEILRLRENGISTVIDLRREEETKRNPDELKNVFKYYNIPLVTTIYPNVESDVVKTYMETLNDKNSMHELLSLLANTKGGIIFHCTTGKDRTGLVSMLLLLIAGVFEDDIIADYEVSYTYIRDIISSMHHNNPSLPDFIGKSKMEYMRDTLREFKKKYYSIDNYMNYIGLGIEEMDKIRSKFFD